MCCAARHPLAWPAHGLTLWGSLTGADAPSTAAARARVAALLALGASSGAGGGEGLGGVWVALSALRLQGREAQAALEASVSGLSWLRTRQEVRRTPCGGSR